MAPVSFSVIVVSRHRPVWLRRCLKAIEQLDYPRFETIVVACPQGEAVALDAGTARVIGCDLANISAARNLGVANARGEVLAFLDDDAVPEPTWLHHLAEGFADPDVAQAGGITLGRNGISVQHAASRVDPAGRTHAVAVQAQTAVKIGAEAGLFPRLHGTNMAIRRSAVADQGGFDPRFAFYLDETDLTLRIAQAGGHTLFVPKAIVHHASGESDRRGADRTPRSLSEIAASVAVFHAKHCPETQRRDAWTAFFNERRAWVLQHMQRGTVTPDEAYRLIRQLHSGYATGQARAAHPPPCLGRPDSGVPVSDRLHRRDLYLVADGAGDRHTEATAVSLVAQGHRVTVFDFRRDARFHHVRFMEAGYWLHRGGIYGREHRSEPLLQYSTRRDRVRRSLERLAHIRACSAPIDGTQQDYDK